MGLAVCQADMDLIGLTAFRAEKQHDVEPPAGGMFNHLTFRHCRWDEVPELIRTTVWVDPAVTDTDQSDAQGIQADGLAPDGTVYRLYSWEDRASPREVLRRAILKAVELKADTVGVETDQGGDLWESEYGEVAEDLIEEGAIEAHEVPTYDSEKAGAGHGPKTARAGKMLSAYERGQFVHVAGTHETLERALRRFPKTKPFDLVDAAFWAWHDLVSNTVPVVAPVSMEQRNSWDLEG
jgi:phage terminase large subunit-like protein